MRVEVWALVATDWNHLAPPTDSKCLIEVIRNALGSSGADIKPYGDGNVAQNIVQKLESGL